MARASKEKTVENATDATDATATPGAPDALQDAGEGSGGSGILTEAETAVEETVAEVREGLSKVEQVVMEWVGDHFSNSPVSRATEALNYLREHAVPDLLKKIKEI